MTALAPLPAADPHARLLHAYLDGLRHRNTADTYRRDNRCPKEREMKLPWEDPNRAGRFATADKAVSEKTQRMLPHAWEAFDPDARRPIALWFAEAAQVHDAAGDTATARHAAWAASVLGAYDEFAQPQP